MTTESQQNINTNNDEISLKELILKMREWWRYLLSKWLIIIIFGVIGGVLGFTYALYKKPVYTATTTFVLEDETAGGGLGSLAGLASIAGFDLGGGGGGIFQGDNILELYKSRKMLQQTLLTEVVIDGKSQTLVNRYIDFNQLRKKWAERSELLKLTFSPDSSQDGNPSIKPNRSRDSIFTLIVADVAKNYLAVGKPDKKLSIIKIDVKAEDEEFAKAFNEQIVKTVNGFYLQTKTRKSLQNVEIMQKKTDSVRGVMNGAIFSAVAVADATPNLNPTRQIQRVAPAQKAQFSAETNKAILGTLVQNLELAKVALTKETPLLEVIDQPILPLAKDRLSKIRGVISGIFLATGLCLVFLIMKRYYKTVVLV